MPAPTASIIIPCHNAEPMIGPCLRSCLAQTHPHIEIILVDNNSTDTSLQTARTLSSSARHPIHITDCPEQGANHARRHGLSLANGDFIQWLDADDLIAPNKIANQLAALTAAPQAMIAYGDWYWRFYKAGQITQQAFFRSTQYDDYLTQLLAGHWRPPAAYLLRRTAADQLEQLNAWNPNTTAEQDRQYFSTAAAAVDIPFLYVPDSESIYNSWSDDQISKAAPIPTRAANVARQFKLLAEQADASATGDSIKSDRRKHHLLNQSTALYKAPPLSIERPNGAPFAVLNRDRDHPVALTEPQAKTLTAVQMLPEAAFHEFTARWVCQILWRRIAWKHHTDDHGVNITTATAALDALLTTNNPATDPLDPPPIPSPTIEGRPDNVAQFLESGPMYNPLFGQQRYRILLLLEQLVEMNLMIPADPPA